MPPIFSKKRAKKGKLAKKFGDIKTKREFPASFNIFFFLVLIGITIFLLAGGLYDLVNKPPMVISIGESSSFFIPNMGSQTVSESIFTGMLTIIGIGGLIIASHSLKPGQNARISSMVLIVSMVMLIFGVIGLQLIFAAKFGNI